MVTGGRMSSQSVTYRIFSKHAFVSIYCGAILLELLEIESALSLEEEEASICCPANHWTHVELAN